MNRTPIGRTQVLDKTIFIWTHNWRPPSVSSLARLSWCLIVDRVPLPAREDIIKIALHDNTRSTPAMRAHLRTCANRNRTCPRAACQCLDHLHPNHFNLIKRFGGNLRLVDQLGEIVTASAELLTYSAQTAHLFEASQSKTIAYSENAVLKEDVTEGWAIDNFEVEGTRNLVDTNFEQRIAA